MTEAFFTKALAAALLVALSGCVYRPARFADRPPVLAVADDAPIPVPKARASGGALDVSDLYIRHAISDALDPTRIPTARDVGAMDRVMRSTWFRPPHTSGPSAVVEDGPPVLPLRLLPGETVTASGGLRAEDARGLAYELQVDPADRPEMRTSSAVIASRLLSVIGYLTAEVWPVDVRASDLVVPEPLSSEAFDTLVRRVDAEAPGESLRLSATRWPIGIDLGPTPVSGVRADDPNDRIAHHDRRTFRAFQLICAWLKLDRYDDGLFRDAYVGAAGAGHVEHFVAGSGGALGVEAIVRPSDLDTDDPIPEDPALPLLTFGFYPREPREPTQTRWLALGEINHVVAPRDYFFTQPFEPSRRALPDDRYWMAKRIASFSPADIAQAVAAGKITDESAEARLIAILIARQKLVVAKGYGQTTPCEVVRADDATLWLRDEAIAFGVEALETSRYTATFLRDTGAPLSPEVALQASGDTLAVPIPPEALSAGYAVARILSLRRNIAAPRPVEVHLRTDGGAVRVVGVRH